MFKSTTSKFYKMSEMENNNENVLDNIAMSNELDGLLDFIIIQCVRKLEMFFLKCD